MNISILGSWRPGKVEGLDRSGTRAQFEEACKTLGTALAENGHRLIVAHPEDRATADHHALKGFEAVRPFHHRVCGAPWLKGHFDAVGKSEAVILVGGSSGTYAAALAALRRRCLIIPIPTFGGAAKAICAIPEVDGQLNDRIRNLGVGKNWLRYLVNAVVPVLTRFPRLLIIHGRGDTGIELRNRINDESLKEGSPLHGIAAPVIMNLQGKGATSVPNEFETLASRVSAAIAIVTADDIGGLARDDHRNEILATNLVLSPRARENIWVEVGWFWGRLGRDHVQLWITDDLKQPSDLQGVALTRERDLDSAWDSIEAFISRLRRGSTLQGDEIDTGLQRRPERALPRKKP